MARDAARVYGWRYQPAIQFERGEGIWLHDVDGKRYYDLTAGMMCNVLGHCHPELVEVMRAEAGKLWHENSWYSNPHLVRFAERIASTLPEGLEVVNFAVTGSEANEVAMRMALAVTGKHDILSVIRGLHGGSLAVESVTTIGGARRRHLGPLLAPANAPAIYAPFCYRCPVNLEYPACDVACLAQSRELIDHVTSGDIAAVLAETMLVAGGMVVPPPEWLPRLKELAAAEGALLVLDEAQLAPARTGKLWGFQHYDVTPDIVTFAKGMSAGLAICGAVTTREIAEEARGKAGLPWAGTYSGDPLPAAVADKQLEIVLRDRLDERAAAMGQVLRAALERLRDDTRRDRRRARPGPLPDARHRERQGDPHARPRHGRAHPPQRGARRRDRDLREEFPAHLPAAHRHRGGDSGVHRAPRPCRAPRPRRPPEGRGFPRLQLARDGGHRRPVVRAPSARRGP